MSQVPSFKEKLNYGLQILFVSVGDYVGDHYRAGCTPRFPRGVRGGQALTVIMSMGVVIMAVVQVELDFVGLTPTLNTDAEYLQIYAAVVAHD
ncbi:hypothetical protein ACROYT_G020620 [Oculina patagonica]